MDWSVRQIIRPLLIRDQVRGVCEGVAEHDIYGGVTGGINRTVAPFRTVRYTIRFLHRVSSFAVLPCDDGGEEHTAVSQYIRSGVVVRVL